MAEPYDGSEQPRDRDPNAPQHPPRSVLNRGVRRRALLTYLPPIVLFFVGAAVLLAYWASVRPETGRDVARGEPRAEGTAGDAADQPGTEGERGRTGDTPGGHNPDPRPAGPREEAERRGGAIITELGEILEHDASGTLGRGVAVSDVDVERVESPTLFWIRDGNARIAVAAPTGSPTVRAGQSVNVSGVVERAGGAVRIRASRVEATNSLH